MNNEKPISPSPITPGYGDIHYLSHTQPQKVAELCFTTERNVRRWRQNISYPKWARRLVELQADYFYEGKKIDAIELSWPKWSGIKLTPQGIETRAGIVKPHDIELLQWKAAFYDRKKRKNYVKPCFSDTPEPNTILYK